MDAPIILIYNHSTAATKFLRVPLSLPIFVCSTTATHTSSLLIYSIPGGILHDPEVHEDPEIFNPDRYMESDAAIDKGHPNDIGQRDDLTFGGGRVIIYGLCVGVGC